ncbi:hypothetical protein OS493_016928, partial [Desmophyllum pertusum]
DYIPDSIVDTQTTYESHNFKCTKGKYSQGTSLHLEQVSTEELTTPAETTES